MRSELPERRQEAINRHFGASCHTADASRSADGGSVALPRWLAGIRKWRTSASPRDAQSGGATRRASSLGSLTGSRRRLARTSYTPSRSSWHRSTITSGLGRVPPVRSSSPADGGRLVDVERDLAGPAALGGAAADLAEHRLPRPAAEVVEHLLLHEPVGARCDQPAHAPERVVRPVAGEPHDERHARSAALAIALAAADRSRDRLGHIEQDRRRPPRCGRSRRSRPALVPEHVEAPAGVLGVGQEGAQARAAPARASRPWPRAAPAAARAFATLWRAIPPSTTGTSARFARGRHRSPSASPRTPSRTRYARPPARRWRRTRADASPSSVKNATLPRTRRANAATKRSSAFSTTQPIRLRDPCDGGLHLGELGQRVDALEVEVVGARRS